MKLSFVLFYRFIAMSTSSKKRPKTSKLWAYAADLNINKTLPKETTSGIYNKQVFRCKLCLDKKFTKK